MLVICSPLLLTNLLCVLEQVPRGSETQLIFAERGFLSGQLDDSEACNEATLSLRKNFYLL